VDVFLGTTNRLAAEDYRKTAVGYQLSENAYRFEADNYRHATTRRYKNAPDHLQT
jgi:hypothetical protein